MTIVSNNQERRFVKLCSFRRAQFLNLNFFLGTRILIAGGRIKEKHLKISFRESYRSRRPSQMAHRDASEKNIDTSYILVVNFDDQSISNIKYKRLPPVPHSFAHAAFGSFRGRML